MRLMSRRQHGGLPVHFMNRKDLLKKISSLILAVIMTLSMSDFAMQVVFAAPADDVTEQTVQGAESGESGGNSAGDIQTVGDSDSIEVEGIPGEDGVQQEDSGNQLPDMSQETDGAQESGDVQDQKEPEAITIEVTIADNRDGMMQLIWEPVENASAYTVTKEAFDAYNPLQTVSEEESIFDTAETEYTFKDLNLSRLYRFTVTARDNDGNIVGVTEAAPFAQPVITPVIKHGRSTRSVSGSRMTFPGGSTNLRAYISEAYNGYAVVQGGCTDGTYAYYLMVSSSNQHGKIVKVRMSDRTIVAKSAVLDIWHGNGMAYDSRRHQLVVSSRDDPNDGVYRKQQLTCIDAGTLKIVGGRQRNVSYSHFASDFRKSYGIASIAYVAKYDVYIADQRITHDLMVIDPDTFEVMGMINTKILDQYPGVYQGMDADDQYAYLLLSSNGNTQKNNLILALDWNSSMLLDSEGRRKQFVTGTWNCANGKLPVAVYRLNTPYEVENIYHTTDSEGRTHFYLSEYFANQQYTKKKVQEAYRVKWKKVKKKVKVAYKAKKRVKWKNYNTKKGKTKWKYRTVKVTKYKWKKKKVWVYKTKYRTVTKTVPSYKDRVDYVYDLGVI